MRLSQTNEHPFYERSPSRAAKPLECGSLLPLFAASLLAVGLLASRSMATFACVGGWLSAWRSVHPTQRQQAGWGKLQQAVAVQRLRPGKPRENYFATRCNLPRRTPK